MSAQVVLAICDDGDDGVPKAGPITRVIRDACAIIDSYLRGIYEVPLADPVPTIIEMVALDLVEGMLCRRHREYTMHDGEEVYKNGISMLEKIRTGKMRLNVMGAPEPPKNEGGTVRSGNPASREPKKKFFLDGTGDF